MKMTFLNLRKLGLVLVAASSMAVMSCGGPTPEEEAKMKADLEAMGNDMFDKMEEAIEETSTTMEESADAMHDEHAGHDHGSEEGHEH